ncbi:MULTISPECIES: rod shape-determining protein MreD [Vibrio]|uniref:Rod shape-determining protein MreD n=1 Tax=Vibrio casei TaxID=673372 RepID=A0A368LPT8_9VIBR|nr:MULTISPECIES: rod shape-determining protein MreD [Vibrio]RCS73892.1 rod shape-determining protein MreD [Vibrio casei]SJN31701.1 Rod shape-determining protein MreD [Vibrio casei]HBV77202.1 rod shape-determining protein MreD [Vibrio sp.]
MRNNIFRTKLIIWISFIIALILQAVPWPGPLEMMRPTWTILITCYWILALPHRVNVGSALILGLMWDLVIGTTLGVHGIVMSVVAYIVALNFQMLRNMALWQQAVLIGLISILGEFLEFFGEFILKDVEFNPHLLWAGAVNCILWPWMFLLLRRVRRRWQMR